MNRTLRTLADRLVWGRSTVLRDYEVACLLAWKAQLSGDAARILDRQLQALTGIKRKSSDKLVLLHSNHRREWYEEHWPADMFFPLRAEKTVARVSLRPAGSGASPLTGEVELFRGRLFSIDLDQPPRTVFAHSTAFNVNSLGDLTLGTIRQNVEVTGTVSLIDPMRTEDVGRAPASSLEAMWPDWVEEWARYGSIIPIRPALSADERRSLLNHIRSTLPGEYLSLVERADGLRVGPCTILGLSDIRKVVRPDGNFYVLAECNESHDVAVSQGATDAVLFRIPYDSDLAIPMGTDFRSAIEQALGNKADARS